MVTKLVRYSREIIFSWSDCLGCAGESQKIT
nr:MAG TPA: hypothetical protein [Caudoviricetes sp.]